MIIKKECFAHVLRFCALWLLLLQACQNRPAPTQQETAKPNTKSASAATYTAVNNWIDDFRNFRTAVYQNDINKQKTYFNFPINADTTQIWDLVYEASVNDRPQNLPGTFTEDDFLKHRSTIFTEAFTKGLLKVKSEKITQKDGYTTPKIKDGKGVYYMVASYDKAAKMLLLTLSYPGGTDEDGSYVSEGEYAILYFFKVENNKFLKFEKVLFAG
jgi:hypothetical protein